MLILYLLQVVIPLAFIIWIACFGARNLLAFGCEVLAALMLNLTLLFTGMWLVPPWWSPYVFAGLTVLAMLPAIRRQPLFESLLPPNALSWLRPLISLVIAIVCLSQLAPALRGRISPEGAIALDYPLESGTYLIVSGGNHGTINSHFLTLGEDEARFRQWRGQSYALDIVAINNWGLRSHGILPREPSKYFIYGRKVTAPCDGIVKTVVDDVADNQVPRLNRDAMSGNHVMISCKGIEVLLAHMIPGSIEVSSNSPVRVGEFIGRVGNSGNSGEPHLHIHVQHAGTADRPIDAGTILDSKSAYGRALDIQELGKARVINQYEGGESYTVVVPDRMERKAECVILAPGDSLSRLGCITLKPAITILYRNRTLSPPDRGYTHPPSS